MQVTNNYPALGWLLAAVTVTVPVEPALSHAHAVTLLAASTSGCGE